MARTANTNIVDQFSDDADVTTMADAVHYLDSANAQASENAIAVARQMGYDGAITVGALEDEIRFYQTRSVEACIELGKRLLILKEMTPHGEFEKRAELLGFSSRTARRFMTATIKFSNRTSMSVLKSAGTHTKLLELLVLDDGEIDALESGETVRGITLDKIETMSVSELKRALRDANERMESKDTVIKDKSAKIDEQAEKLAALELKKRNEAPVSADQSLIDARSNLQIAAADIKAGIMTRLRKCIKDLHETAGAAEASYMAGCLIDISRELIILRDDYNLPATVTEDLTPEWMRPGALEAVEREYAGLPSVTDVLNEE